METTTEEITIRVSHGAAHAYRAIDPRQRRLSENVISCWLEVEGANAEQLMRRRAAEPPVVEYWQASVPVNPDAADEGMVGGEVIVLPDRTTFGAAKGEGKGMIDATSLRIPKEDKERATWLRRVAALHVEVDCTRKMIRVLGPATREQAKALRVPLWIQDDETPECCGLRMSFVGQIDDNETCTQPPPGAVLWWHDTASFYVFTCPICLGVKAVGQQY